MSEAMGCPKCNTTLVAVERVPSPSFVGFVSALFFIAGLITLLFIPLIGVVIIIVALLINLAKGKQTWLMCPACQEDVIKL